MLSPPSRISKLPHLHPGHCLTGYSIANATADLLLMAAWSCVMDTVEGDEPIPVCILSY